MFPWMRYECRSPPLRACRTASDKLRKALSRNRIDTFSKLLKEGAGVNTTDQYNITPLHWVLYWKKDFDVVKAVLSAGADPNAIDCNGNTPLHIAINSCCSLPIIKALLTIGADSNAIDFHGNTPLHIAIKSYSSPVTIKALLNAGAEIDMPDSLGRSPLMKSIHLKSNKSVIGILLSTGANVNVPNLMVEAVKANTDPQIIKWFIMAGASVNGSSFTNSPILYAVINDDHKVVKLLLAAGARIDFLLPMTGCTLLHFVRGVGVTQELIMHGIDVNAVDKLGKTPLHTAVTRDLLDVATTLIKAGADVNSLVKIREDNCLHCARSRAMVKMLALHGLDINARNFEGSTPLHILLKFCIFMPSNDRGIYMPHTDQPYLQKKNKAISAVIQLIKCGADVNATDDNDRTVLVLAVHVGSLKILVNMIKHGLNVCWDDLISLPVLNRVSMKLLIREWAIGNLKGEDVRDYPFDHKNELHKDLLRYATKCNREIELMKVEKINCYNTIYHYVVEIAPKIKALRLCSHYDISDEDCKSLFPIYYNKVSVRLNMCYRRAGILDVLEKINIRAPTADRKGVVSLINDCKVAIVEHLSNNDLVNFLLAMGIKNSDNAVSPKSMNCGEISPPFDSEYVRHFF